jgi:cytochrome c-type biogenesis protein CcmH
VRRIVAALVAVAALAVPGAALAQQCPRTSLGDIEDEVMCPICGTPLGLATEAPQAQDEREFIQRLIDDCRSKDEIKQALVAQYGERVLALPGDEGGEDDLGDVLVYVIPALAVLLAAGGIVFAVLRWRRSGRAGKPLGGDAAGIVSSKELEQDLERYDL